MRPTRTPLDSPASLITRLSFIVWVAPYALLVIVGIIQLLSPMYREEMWQSGHGWVAIVVAAVWVGFALIVSVIAIACGPRSLGLASVFAGRCPHCGRRSLQSWESPEPSSPFEWAECRVCEAGYRRRPGEPWEVVYAPPEYSRVWLLKYLPRLREARRRMRPDVVPKLDLPFTDGPIDLESALRPAPAGPRGEGRKFNLRFDLVVLALLALIVMAACLVASGTRAQGELRVVAILGATYVVYSCLMVGWLWHLKGFQVLLLTATTAAIMAVQVRMVGWIVHWPPIVALTLALILPATPIGIGLLIARFRDQEPGPEGETTSGRLLRIKRRLPSYAGRGTEVVPTPSPTTGDQSWSD